MRAHSPDQGPTATIRYLTDAQRDEFSVDDMQTYGDELVKLLST